MNRKSWYQGTLWIFATCGFLLNGFQAIPHAIEEKAQEMTMRRIAALIVISIGAAAVFYCLVVAALALSAPWRAIAAQPMAAASAVRTLPFGGALTTVLLCAAAASLVKSWNGNVVMGSRVLMAMARAGLAPAKLGAVHPRHGSPANAVWVVFIVTSLGIFMGKTVILPIVNMCSMTLTLNFVMCCGTVILLRTRDFDGGRAFRVPGGLTVLWIGTLGSIAMAVSAFVTPWLRNSGTVPLEWILLSVWSGVGFIVWLWQCRGARRNFFLKQ